MVDDMNLTSAPGMLGTDPELHNRLVWYSYLTGDAYGDPIKMHTKRYLDWGTYKEVCDSDFVDHVTVLYEADNREAAVKEGTRLTKAHFLSRLHYHGGT